MSSPGRQENKTFAAVLALALLLVVLLSSVYIAREAGHECRGEECPICASIEQCRNTLRQVSEVIAGCAIFMAAALAVCFAPRFLTVFLIPTTPVTCRVRLNR
ncbi:MAG: hypothetical protein K6E83_01640 [Clostridium sp.]|nr:hypothetical protein [Clostridium sp.]